MKLLHLDIETMAAKVYTFELFKTNIGVGQIITPPRVICFAAQWHGQKAVQFHSEWSDGRKGLLRAAHRLMSEADAICGYYNSRFDIPWLNGEFMRERMGPPAPALIIDLKQELARKAHFISNKLAHVGELLNIGKKVEHEGFGLWAKVDAGDRAARKRMEAYNRQDTALMAPLYTLLLPWLTNHPNMGHWARGVVCRNCGSADLRSNGWRLTAAYKYRRLVCKACGTWSREVTPYKAPNEKHAPRTALRAI